VKHEYENDIPVNDELTVLDLLYSRWGDCTTRHISLWPHAPPHVEIGHHRDFGDSDYRRFLVTERVVEKLRNDDLICGVPRWGYTERRELRISDAGSRLLDQRRREAGMDDYYRMSAEHWLERRCR
jgi:hypothetical protein